MTAAILPISPFWQLRDSSRYDPDLQPSKTGPVLYEGGTRPIYEGLGLNSSMILATVTYDVDLCVSGGQGNTSRGFYLVCPAGQEISDSKEISRDLFHVRKRRRANIRLRTGIQRPQRRASDHKADPFQRLYTYTHTRVYTCICIHDTYRRVSKPHRDMQHLWDFLVFDQLAHPLCMIAP